MRSAVEKQAAGSRLGKAVRWGYDKDALRELEARRARILKLHTDGWSGQRIAEEIGVSRVAVCHYLRSVGIHGKNYAYLSRLAPRQQAILLGTLLGDGCLKRFNERSNAQLTLAHCAAQAGYLRWKVGELSRLFKSAPTWYVTRDGHRSLCASSRSHPILTAYYTLFYGTGRKAVGLEVLDRLDSAAHLGLLLAVWYMDDGSVSARDARSPGSRRSASLALGGLDAGQYTAIREWFARHGMSGRLCRYDAANCVVLRFGVVSSEVFFRMVRPHIHPDLRYKLPEGRSKVVREGGRR